MQAGGAVRSTGRCGLVLRRPGRVGGAHRERVLAGRGVPRPGPLPPGVDRGDVVERAPSATARRRPAPPRPRRRGAGPRRPRRPRRRRPSRRRRRRVDAGLQLDRRLRRPAAADPVGVEVGEAGQLQLGQPLRGRHVAVEAGHDHPDREAVLDRQRLAVHADGEQGVAAVAQHRGRGAGGEPVDRPADHLVGAGLRIGLVEQVADPDAEPARVADQVAADLVGDAGERDVPLDHRPARADRRR